MANDYRTKIVETGLSYLGTTAPTGDDQFITAYNKWANTTFSVNGTPWCAIFVTFCARTAGVPTTVIPNFASCSNSLSTFFKPKNLWQPRTSNYTPLPGDLIYYDWDIDSSPNHVGIVTGFSNGKVSTIEGNTKKDGVYGVWQKSYLRASQYILGFATPSYGIVSTTTGSSQTVLSPMVSGTYVRKFQTWLNTNYKQSLAVDGIFGPKTKKAAIVAWQTAMNKTFGMTLEVDGIFGPLSKNAARRKTLSKGNAYKNLNYILQGMLYAKDLDPKGFDGIFGNGCQTALKTYQTQKGYPITGITSDTVWNGLFNE